MTVFLDPQVRPADPALGSTLETQFNTQFCAQQRYVAWREWVWMDADMRIRMDLAVSQCLNIIQKSIIKDLYERSLRVREREVF